jgi:hypothetical protein
MYSHLLEIFLPTCLKSRRSAGVLRQPLVEDNNVDIRAVTIYEWSMVLPRFRVRSALEDLGC